MHCNVSCWLRPLSRSLFVCELNACCVRLSPPVSVRFDVCPVSPCLFVVIPACSCDVLVCLCVQRGEDGCSVSSNWARWTGRLRKPPRSTGSAGEQRERHHSRKEVTRERGRWMVMSIKTWSVAGPFISVVLTQTRTDWTFNNKQLFKMLDLKTPVYQKNYCVFSFPLLSILYMLLCM